MIKAVSFDLDGTLADEKFDNMVWLEELPRLFAEKHKLSFQDAQDKVFSQYYRAQYIEKLKLDEWTDVSYWMERLELGGWKKLIDNLKKQVFVFPDAVETLQMLHKKYKLIIISNANDRFLNIKLEAEGLKQYFDFIYSAPSRFGMRKSKPVFENILQELKLKPEEVVHIGDDHDGDYLTPKEIGIHAFHLLRDRKQQGPQEIQSLTELPGKIEELTQRTSNKRTSS